MKKLLHFKMHLIALMIFPLSIIAQGTITGTITEASSNSPLSGANIVVKGTTTGTISDFDGNFSLNVDTFPVTLVVSSVGYNTKEVNVSSAGNISTSRWRSVG